MSSILAWLAHELYLVHVETMRTPLCAGINSELAHSSRCFLIHFAQRLFGTPSWTTMNSIFASILVVFAATQAIHAHTPSNTYDASLQTRQFTVSRTFAEICPSKCTEPIDQLQSCLNKKGDGCFCSNDYVPKMTACYDCVLDVDQTKVDFQEWEGFTPEDAQHIVSDLYNDCVKDGFKIAKPKLTHSNATDDSTGNGTDTATAPETTPTDGALGSLAVSYVVAVGALGTAVVGLFL